MRTFAIIALVLGVGLSAVMFWPDVTEYTVPAIVQTETEVVVKDALDARVEAAQKEQEAAIEAKAKAAYDAARDQALKEIALEVTAAYRKEVEAKETQLSKEVGAFWRDRKRVEHLIRQTFPEDPQTAVAIAKCESGLNPEAHNPHNKDGTTDGGLFQINDVHNKRLQELGLDRYNPEDAAQFARMLWEEEGWHPWVCYRKMALR